MGKRSRSRKTRIEEFRIAQLEKQVASLNAALTKPRADSLAWRALNVVLIVLGLLLSLEMAKIATRTAAYSSEQTKVASQAHEESRALRIAELQRVLLDREPCDADPMHCPHRASLRVREVAAADLIALDPARLAWVDLRSGHLSNHFSNPSIVPVDLSHAHLDWADMFGARLRTANLNQAVLEHANLTNADLRGVNLEYANLIGAFIGHARIQGARMMSVSLNEAIAEGADFTDADLFGATLEHIRGKGARFDRANIAGARLQGADLEGARFAGATLRDSILWKANLNRADLTGADLRGANLQGARFDGVVGLDLVQCDEETIWPNVWEPRCAKRL